MTSSDDLVVAIFFRQQKDDLLTTLASLSFALQVALPADAQRAFSRLRLQVFDNGSRPDAADEMRAILKRESALFVPFRIEEFRLPLPKSRGEALSEAIRESSPSSFFMVLEAGFEVAPTFCADVLDFFANAHSERATAYSLPLLRVRRPSYACGWILPRDLFHRIWSGWRRVPDEGLDFEVRKRLREAAFEVAVRPGFALRDARSQREWDELVYLNCQRRNLLALAKAGDPALWRESWSFCLRALRALIGDLWRNASVRSARHIVSEIFSKR